MESCCAITVVAVFTEQDGGIQKNFSYDKGICLAMFPRHC